MFLVLMILLLLVKHMVSQIDNITIVYNELVSDKGVIFHIGHESKYHLKKRRTLFLLNQCQKENGVEKIYVFDPNGNINYVNVLFPLKKAVGGIELAKKRTVVILMQLKKLKYKVK